jgi:uncharacterized membrane protein YfcA
VEVLMVYAELIGAGLLAGFLAGLLGIGGGFVVVPALLLLLPAFGIPADLLPKVAVATSLAAMVPTAASAVYAQHRRGALDCSWITKIAPGACVGAAVGALLAASVTGVWVAIIFATYTGYFAMKMTLDRPQGARAAGPLAVAVARCPSPLVGALIGGFSAIAGVGGASLTVPYLLSKNAEMKRAVATASAVGLGIALIGAVSFAFTTASTGSTEQSSALLGLVCWPAALILGAGSILMAPRGVAASHKLPVRHLKRAFGVVLLAACVMTIIKIAPSEPRDLKAEMPGIKVVSSR